MIIGSQVSINNLEFVDRKNRGVKFIELILSADVLKDITNLLMIKPTLKQLDLSVYAVKSPQLNSYGTACVLGETNGLKRKDNLNLIKKSILVANKLSNTAVPMVILNIGGIFKKCDLTTNIIKSKKEMVEKDIKELIIYVNLYYPNTILLLENNKKIEENTNNLYGYGYDEDLVKWLKGLKYRQLGICLNVANAMNVIHYNESNQEESSIQTVSDYISVYAPFLKLIHLSNVDKSSHTESGLAYYESSNKDLDVLREIFKAISYVKYHSAITISTNEVDNANAINFTNTKNSIIQSFKKG